MFRSMKQWGHDPAKVRRAAPSTFNAPLKWAKKMKSGETKRVFTCSFSDFFHEDADPWRAEAWDIIRATPQITYLILTKRPERIYLDLPELEERENVWLGTSAEDQETFDKRVLQLSVIVAPVRFISMEPLLGPITMRQYQHYPAKYSYMNPIDWVIVGGESGPGAREMRRAWVDQIKKECEETGTAFFFKQWSGLRPGNNPTIDGTSYEQFPTPR